MSTPDASARIRELLEHGIAQVKAGEHDLGMSAFEEAGRQATEAGLTGLAAGAAIDRGWALWLAGDREASTAAYKEGAALSREAADDKRLVIALGNLGIAYTDARLYEDADALYAEYVPLVIGDPDEEVDARLNWSAALEALGQADSALAQLDEAQRIAVEGGLDAALVRVHIAQGGMRERAGEADEAFELYWKAFDIASEAEDAELVGDSTLRLGYAYTRHGDHAKAADCLGEAARAYKYLEDGTRLGPVLYEHGRALLRVGLLDQALEVWREAEPVFRETDDQRALGECLLQQALAVRDQLSNMAPDLQFTEAAAAFRAAGMLDRLPEVLLTHAQWCWDRQMDDAVRTRVEEALAALSEASDPVVESRTRALYAQLLADERRIEDAEAELARAQAVAEEAGDAEGVTGVWARRAYVMARAGAAFEDVKAQLLAAGLQARAAGHEAAGRYAADAVATEIEERCGRMFRDLLAPDDEKNVPVPSPEHAAGV